MEPGLRDSHVRHASIFIDRRRVAAGLTLIELVVTMAILSILAAAALPYAEITLRREREAELRAGLREIRTAIDRFHEDASKAKTGDASDDGYPRNLEVLVNGVASPGTAAGRRVTYLRRIPRDPFAGPDLPPAEQWVLRGYQDAPDSLFWNGKDVYDVRSRSDKQALDGTYYRDW